MSNVYLGRAAPGDEAAIIDFINMVFSHDHRPHDFPTLLPKLYGPGRMDAAAHYIVREDAVREDAVRENAVREDAVRDAAVRDDAGGGIRACVGVYPLRLRVGGETLNLRGVGAVSAHPYHRGKGYMRALMDLALGDMERDGVDMAVLGGQRQRYQYFGFESAGVGVSFEVTAASARHALGEAGGEPRPLDLRPVGPADDDQLTAMRGLHTGQALAVEREPERFHDILCTWEGARPVAALRDGVVVGYASARGDDAGSIQELVLADEADMHSFLRAWFRAYQPRRVGLTAGLRETARIERLRRICESMAIRATDMFRVFNFRRVIGAFLAFKATYMPLSDGVWTAAIGGEGLRVAVSTGVPSVTPCDGPFDTRLDPLEATARLFGPAAFVAPLPWSPLPLYISPADGV